MVFSEPWTGLPPVQWSPGLTSSKMQPTRLDTIADSWKGSLLRNVFHIFRVTPCTCASQNTFVIATTWSRPEENNYVSSENILETTSAVTRDTWLPVTNKGIASTEYTLCCNILPVATSWLPAREIVFFPPLGRKCGNLPRVSTIHVPSTALLSGGLQSWHRCYEACTKN